MAITTYAGVVAGLQKPSDYIKIPGAASEAANTFFSQWYAPGRPASGVASSAGLSGEALTAPVLGALPYYNPPSGFAYLARFQGISGNVGDILLLDRLWQNSGTVVTTTTAQTVNSVAWPARDRNGATNGDDVWVGIEVSTATTNAGAITNMTLGYTNQAGTASRTGTMSSYGASGRAGLLVPFELQAGDTGIRSVQTLTLGTSLVTGVVSLVAFRILERIAFAQGSYDYAVDAVSGCFQRLYDGSVLWPVSLCNGANTMLVAGTLMVTHG